MSITTKKIFGLIGIGLLIIIAGCGGQNAEEMETEKRPFYVETVEVSELSQETEIKKSGRIIGTQDIMVTSQVAGRVENIGPSLGGTMQEGALVLRLSDSSGNYTIAAQKASAALEQAKINYEDTMQSLNQTISDTQIAIQQAQNQAQDSDLGGGSSADYQLQQLQSQLDKAQIDLDTRIENDQQTIENHIDTTRDVADSIKLLYEDVIRAGDQILGVTQERRYENDQFEDILGIRNTATKRTAEMSLRKLIQEYEALKQYSPRITQNTLSRDLETLKEYTEKLNPVLVDIQNMLNFTNPDETLPASQLSQFKTNITGLQSQVQTQISNITGQISTIRSFLRTYQQQQDAIRENIVGLERQISSTRQQLQTAETSSDLDLQSAQNSYQNSLENKETTKASLQNAITQAQISANEAQNQLEKLTVEAPIGGIISDIFVDVGQEVNAGTELFSITSDQQQQIEIALTNDEVALVQEGQSVQVTSNGNTYDATLTSVASSANSTLGYKATVSLDNPVSLVGTVANVTIPIQTDSFTIPLRYVKILNKDQGQVALWKNGTVEQVIVELGKVWGSTIEITDNSFNNNTEIVTNDISNYNEDEFTLTKKQQ